jgi:predicted negative regulator of RcsB-dependent stress response
LRDVAVEVERVGTIQLQQGKLADALKSFQQSEGLAEILARADPNDSELQRGLAVSHNKIGDVLMAEGDLTGALDEYRKALAITSASPRAIPPTRFSSATSLIPTTRSASFCRRKASSMRR